MIYTMQPHVVSKYSTHTEPRPFIFELTLTAGLPLNITLSSNQVYPYYNYNVDVNGVRRHTGLNGDVTLTFTTPGKYLVDVSGIYPTFSITGSVLNVQNILDVKQWGTQIWRGNLVSPNSSNSNWNRILTAIDKPDLRLVNSLRFALSNINQPTSTIVLSKWNTRYVTSFQEIASVINVNTLNLSGWKTNNVTSMVSSFTQAKINTLNLNGWNTSNVTTMSNMFRLAIIPNLNVNHFDVGKVQSFEGMFEGTSWTNMIELSNWKPTSLVTADTMFVNAVNNSNNTIELDRIYQNWAQYLPTHTSGTHILDFGRARCSNSVLSFRTQIINKGWTIYDDRSPRP